MSPVLEGLPAAHGRARPDVDVHTVVVGAGYSGLALAVGLRRAGQDDFLVLEMAQDVGGVWRDNVYPGAACDVPSYLYSLASDPRKDWDRPCPRQPVIHDYLGDVTDHHRLRERMRFGVEVTSAAWDDEAAAWTIELADGSSLTCAVLALACGQLSKPSYPDVPGIEDFGGASFHSARWDHDVDLTGKRVAVVGTGASAAQFVPPVAEAAAHTDVYQRTANWILPRRNRPYAGWARWAIERIPGLQALRRNGMRTFMESGIAAQTRIPPLRLGLRAWSMWHMKRQVTDPEDRRKLIPDYAIGCKRVLFSSAFLPALVRDDVEVVTDSVVRVTETGVVSRDPSGAETERPVDVIVWGTGFKTQEFVAPIEVRGTRSPHPPHQAVRLADAWSDGAAAHLGITVAGFPNMFLLYGPNTNLGFGSIVIMIEAQVRYVLDALRRMRASGLRAIEVRPEVMKASTDEVQDRLQHSVWTSCTSWYQGKGGRIVNNYPGQMVEYQRDTRAIDLDEYRTVGAAPPTDRAGAAKVPA